MFHYSIVSHPNNFSISEQSISEIFEYCSRYIDIPQNGILNIAFIDDGVMQSLNSEYRGIDKTTDVLSFHYFEDFSIIDEDTVSGECIFSESKILLQAREHNHSPEKEFCILLIHSVLHILGFDHESEEEYENMWKYEKSIREYFSLSTSR